MVSGESTIFSVLSGLFSERTNHADYSPYLLEIVENYLCFRYKLISGGYLDIKEFNFSSIPVAMSLELTLIVPIFYRI